MTCLLQGPTSTRKYLYGKIRVPRASQAAALDQLPEAVIASELGSRVGVQETRAVTTVRHRSLSRARPIVCLRARPTDSLLVILTSAFVGLGRKGLGLEGCAVTIRPRCNAVDIRHASRRGTICTCPRERMHRSTSTSRRSTQHPVHCGGLEFPIMGGKSGALHRARLTHLLFEKMVNRHYCVQHLSN